MSTTTNIASSHEHHHEYSLITWAPQEWPCYWHFWPLSQATLSHSWVTLTLFLSHLVSFPSLLALFQIHSVLIPNPLRPHSKFTQVSFQSHSVLIPWLFYELSAEYRDPIPEGGEKSKVDANVPPTSPESITGILDNVLFFCRKCLTLLSLPLYRETELVSVWHSLMPSRWRDVSSAPQVTSQL